MGPPRLHHPGVGKAGVLLVPLKVYSLKRSTAGVFAVPLGYRAEIKSDSRRYSKQIIEAMKLLVNGCFKIGTS